MTDFRLSANLELSPAVFSILSSLIEEKLGLQYTILDRELLQSKASTRAHEAGFGSLLDYYYFLRYDINGVLELNELVEALVVNETYFFREWKAIEVLVHNFIAPMCAAGKRPRIWSAACSTGEEPLSMAMLLDELGILDQVEIVASDISKRVLARPLKGMYGRRSIRSVPSPKLLNNYLEALGDDGYKIDERLVNSINWKQFNLLNFENYSEMGTFDFILCRNVLIYFSDVKIKAVIDQFLRTLSNDGILMVGVSESLLRYGNTFSGEEIDGAFVYRKPRLN